MWQAVVGSGQMLEGSSRKTSLSGVKMERIAISRLARIKAEFSYLVSYLMFSSIENPLSASVLTRRGKTLIQWNHIQQSNGEACL